MLALPGRGNRRLGVESARCGDSDDINIIAPEQLLVIFEGTDTIFVSEFFSSVGNFVAAADELRVRQVTDGAGMKISDQPGANNSKIPGFHICLPFSVKLNES